MLSLECNFTYTLLVLSHIHTQIEKPKWKVYTSEVYDQNNCSWFRRGSTAGEDSASSKMYFLTAAEQVHVSFEPSNHKSLLCEEAVQHLNSILVKRLLHLVPIQISLVSLIYWFILDIFRLPRRCWPVPCTYIQCNVIIHSKSSKIFDMNNRQSKPKNERSEKKPWRILW